MPRGGALRLWRQLGAIVQQQVGFQRMNSHNLLHIICIVSMTFRIACYDLFAECSLCHDLFCCGCESNNLSHFVLQWLIVEVTKTTGAFGTAADGLPEIYIKWQIYDTVCVMVYALFL